MKYSLVIFAALIAVTFAAPSHLFGGGNVDEPLQFADASFAQGEVHSLFKAWKAEHNKVYETIEESFKRFGIFWSNLEKIHAHNKKNLSWKMAMNHFGDLTASEFKQTYANLDTSKIPLSKKYSDLSNVKAAETIDWRTKGAVTAVKNQGQCGSCWSFSSTGGLEGANYITNGKLISLSEKNLMDCSWSEGNMGCNGGLMDNAFQYVEKSGICSEESYPYDPVSSQTCKKCTPVVHITGYTDVPAANEEAFNKALSQAPVSIAIEADQTGFQFYSSGVMSATCGTGLDHGVLAVAYDSESYTIKNSWGPSWGESGFIRLARGSQYNNGQGQCGMFLKASQPQAAKSEVESL
jgi:C1A family cysteine protease